MKYLLTSLLVLFLVGCTKKDEASDPNKGSISEQQNSTDKSSKHDNALSDTNLQKIASARFIDCDNPINEQIQFLCTDAIFKSSGLTDDANLYYDMAILNPKCVAQADLLGKKFIESVSKCTVPDHACFLGVMNNGGLSQLAELGGLCSGSNR